MSAGSSFRAPTDGNAWLGELPLRSRGWVRMRMTGSMCTVMEMTVRVGVKIAVCRWAQLPANVTQGTRDQIKSFPVCFCCGGRACLP